MSYRSSCYLNWETGTLEIGDLLSAEFNWILSTCLRKHLTSCEFRFCRYEGVGRFGVCGFPSSFDGSLRPASQYPGPILRSSSDLCFLLEGKAFWCGYLLGWDLSFLGWAALWDRESIFAVYQQFPCYIRWIPLVLPSSRCVGPALRTLECS